MLRLLALLPLAWLAACTDGASDDLDDDGGSDGTVDGADGTDGSDGSDGGSAVYGPDNSWYHAPADEVPADLAGSGTRPGDVFGDFSFVDQFGDDVELYQFYGKVVQIALVAEWCGICRDEAPDIDAVGTALADDAVIITILMEDSSGRTPDTDTAARWADDLGVTGPVLAGPGDLGASVRGGFPTLPLLDREMVIVTDDNFPFSSRAIEDVIGD